MADRSSDLAPRTAVDIVRERLEEGAPAGFRLGTPQTAGRLTLLPVFCGGPGLDYVTLAAAEQDGDGEAAGGRGVRARLVEVRGGSGRRLGRRRRPPWRARGAFGDAGVLGYREAAPARDRRSPPPVAARDGPVGRARMP